MRCAACTASLLFASPELFAPQSFWAAPPKVLLQWIACDVMFSGKFFDFVNLTNMRVLDLRLSSCFANKRFSVPESLSSRISTQLFDLKKDRSLKNFWVAPWPRKIADLISVPSCKWNFFTRWLLWSAGSFRGINSGLIWRRSLILFFHSPPRFAIYYRRFEGNAMKVRSLQINWDGLLLSEDAKTRPLNV